MCDKRLTIYGASFINWYNRYRYIAVDPDGSIRAFTVEPKIYYDDEIGYWHHPTAVTLNLPATPESKAVAWAESLIAIPI